MDTIDFYLHTKHDFFPRGRYRLFAVQHWTIVYDQVDH
jgi:hypothetical protein